MSANDTTPRWVIDVLSQKIFVGDMILYATLYGRSPVMRLAKVVEFVDLSERVKENAYNLSYQYPYGCKIRVEHHGSTSLLEKAQIVRVT